MEGDFDLSLGFVNARYNKENKPKIVPFLEGDIELVKSFPTALPHLYFFRHGIRKGVPKNKGVSLAETIYIHGGRKLVII